MLELSVHQSRADRFAQPFRRVSRRWRRSEAWLRAMALFHAGAGHLPAPVKSMVSSFAQSWRRLVRRIREREPWYSRGARLARSALMLWCRARRSDAWLRTQAMLQ